MGGCCTVSVLLDGADFGKKLRRLQFRVHPEVFYPVADFAKLFRCLYGGAACKVLFKHGHFYGGDYGFDVACYRICGLCLCKIAVSGKRPGIYTVSGIDDGAERTGGDYKLCDHYQYGPAEYLSGTDFAVSNVGILYLSAKRKLCQVPDELYYAAKVDATSDLKYLFKVLLPICKPTVVTIVILKVIECWNSYVWPRLITDDKNYFLVSNGIQEIRENGFGRENIPAMMAAVVVISLPLIILFLVFRKKIMAGVSRGGTKG